LEATFADTDSSAGCVDEPCTLLHLGDEFLVEQTSCVLMERTVDSNDISLSEHFLEVMNAAAANFFLNFRGKGLVIKVEKLLAIEGNKTSQNTLADTADSDCSYDFTFNIEGVFGDGCNIPVTRDDLFVCGDKVANKDKNTKNDCFHQLSSNCQEIPCSATDWTLEPVTSATRIFFSLAAFKSI
jgi:hypothetical protein